MANAVADLEEELQLTRRIIKLENEKQNLKEKLKAAQTELNFYKEMVGDISISNKPRKFISYQTY